MRWALTVACVMFLNSGAASLHADLDALLNYMPPEVEVPQENGTSAPALPNSAYVLDEPSLLDALREALVEHYELSGELTLQPLQRWNPMPLTSERWRVEVLTYPGGGLEARFALTFRVHNEGRVVGQWTWPLLAQLWCEAYVARHQINAGSTLGAGDFITQKCDALSLRAALLPAKAKLANYQVRRTIDAGSPLYWNDLDARPLVLKGKTVSVLAEQGALSITMRAKAMEDGALGDIVNVRNLDSNKRIQGEVVDENTVRVYF